MIAYFRRMEGEGGGKKITQGANRQIAAADVAPSFLFSRRLPFLRRGEEQDEVEPFVVSSLKLWCWLVGRPLLTIYQGFFLARLIDKREANQSMNAFIHISSASAADNDLNVEAGLRSL